MSAVQLAPPAARGAAQAQERRAGTFDRLRRLLHGQTPPGELDPVLLHLGEIEVAPPPGLLEPLARSAEWSRYPPLGGTEALRRAYAGWLERRFGVADALDAGGLAAEPTAGSKHALATLIALAAMRARERGIGRPAIILPNPFYPTYLAATAAAGAEPIFYPVPQGDPGRAISGALARAAGRAAAVVLCNPGTPDGGIVEESGLSAAAECSARAGAILIVDECYVDLFASRAPTGLLALCGRGTVSQRDVVVLHTLSKRSGTPGLRSGFVTGDPGIVALYASHNRTCGVSSSFPICAAAAALWADDGHVQRVRDAIARNWDLADAHLAGMLGYRRAQTGFFLWLAVADDEATALRLWHRHAIMVMPGRYLGAEDGNGGNPGIGRVRIALVQEPERMLASLRRLRAALEEADTCR